MDFAFGLGDFAFARTSRSTDGTIPDMDPDHRKQLIAACESNNTSVLAELLGSATDVDSSVLAARALRAALARGDPDVTRALLDMGVDLLASEACDGEAHTCAIPSAIMVQECIQRHCNQTALQVAARYGNFYVLRYMLDAGAPVNAPAARYGGRTALQAASEVGHSAMVEYLLLFGAEANAPPAARGGVTALQGACEGGHARIVAMLVHAGAQVDGPGSEVGGRTALRAAVKGNHVQIVSTLLDAGACVGIAELTAAIDDNCIDILCVLLKTARIKDRTVMLDLCMRAVKHGNLDILDVLSKAFPSSLLPQWLWIAGDVGDPAIVGHLLSHSITGPIISELRRAAEGGNTKLVEILLDLGAVEIDARDTDGRTCLTFGIAHPSLVRALLRRGADPHLRGLDGATPLHTAIQGQHLESTILLLKSGVDVELEDYENQKPLDIALSDASPSPESISIVQALLEHGCDIGRRDMARWRTVLMGSDTDVVLISETTCPAFAVPSAGGAKDPACPKSRAKTSIGIKLVKQAPELPQFSSSLRAEVPEVRRLCSGPGAKLTFPAMDPRLMSTGSAVEWQWRKLDGEFTPFGRGLSTVAGLVTSIDTQALLSCYVSFEYITRVPGNQKQDTTGTTFETRNQRSEICWTMRKVSPPAVDPANIANAAPTPVFRSVDFRSTLEIGWVPENGVDFFTWFVIDLHKKWRVVFDDADTHLRKNRRLLLRNKGRTTEFIDNLLFDAQQWSNFRALLEMHVRTARDLAQDFTQKRYLCAEVNMHGGGVSHRKKAPAAVAIERLSKAIQRMEAEVENEIRKLDEQTKGMIELEFNLVSIYEARTSKIMGMSMKRLSWITFIFLPLMFVASLFGMNVDVINSGPHWWWVAVLGAVIFTLVIAVWGLLKIFRPEESSERDQSTTDFPPQHTTGGLQWHGHVFPVANWRKLALSRTVDVESGQAPAAAAEFKSPGRQWTKLKDL